MSHYPRDLPHKPLSEAVFEFHWSAFPVGGPTPQIQPPDTSSFLPSAPDPGYDLLQGTLNARLLDTYPEYEKLNPMAFPTLVQY